MKSVEVKLNEAIAALTKAKLIEKFNEQFTNKQLCPIEVQLNGALSLLKSAGIIESITESAGWGLTFAPKPHIPKKNGATLNESAGQITEAERKVATKKEALVESVMKSCNRTINPEIGEMTEAGARVVLGLPTKAPEGLKGYQVVEYNFARRCGLSESDALALAKLPLKRR